MASAGQMAADFAKVVAEHGIPYTMQIYTRTFDDYDQETLAASGSPYTGSLMVFPLGKDEKQYLENGVLQVTDKKIFFSGAEVNETATFVFSAGSWVFAGNGLLSYALEGQNIYYKAFVRAKT